MTQKRQKAARLPVKAGTSKEAAAARKAIFVEAYIANGGNATEAAKTAGFSEKTARQQGARLLSDVSVSSAIAARAKETAERYELTTDLVTQSIVRELRFDPKRLYNEDGSLKAITDLDDDTAAALAGVEFVQLGSADAPVFVRKYKWAPKSTAREQAMKHLGMFEADNRQRSGLLSELPRETVKAIAERLNQLNGKPARLD